MLDTEQLNSHYDQLDTLGTADVVRALVDDQTQAVQAVSAVLGDLTRAVDETVTRLARGGRLIYAGAGTSGRLAQLDAAELVPTFSWPAERAVALLAGGRLAMFEAQEGAEDSTDGALQDLAEVELGAGDVVIAVAASGTTPYTVAALRRAREVGALAIGMANNPGTPLLLEADIPLCLHTGAEVIGGSTRLKAGSAQKIALNTFSSAVMVRLGKVYGNLMVDVKASNHKLRERAVMLVMTAAGVSETEARAVLAQADFKVNVAIVSLLRGVSVSEARALLQASGGHVRAAITSTS
ncbi:N-acetylmuramic acid 6-phosphate etherase [Deinococcus peraridilitoris]|uniref:N-acetylmuramic acid 6-phosphate etherase n=1 Tax=Deinococcus peraridilitoris (strain DSM 19664 / LMG 22246 / CIP 109416 / KR-200) TaxID=937777 RepID=L0A2R1_DEIPD|nr:N-acetylmuramic acid 6-phosphate etherase [Deinococcus peraridilitoris]AFZ67305.1 N-acetylmuramic acid 6-phosphate etherase [Deinococcus peraridilitoris DSM 19664]